MQLVPSCIPKPVRETETGSDLETFVSQGEFKEDAQERYQEEIDKAEAVFELSVTVYTALVGVIGAALAWAVKASPIAVCLVGIFTVVGVYYVWLKFKNDLDKKKKKIKDKNKPKIDELPSKT